MTTHTDPLFCDTTLARRIEQAEVDLIGAANSAARRRGAPGFLIPVAGGVASFADHGSPYNKVTGLGFDGIPDGDELDRVERAFATHGAPTQVELAHLADPAIGDPAHRPRVPARVLRERPGPLTRRTEAPCHCPTSTSVAAADDEFDAWLAVMADAAAHPDTEGRPLARGVPALRSTRRRCATLRGLGCGATPPYRAGVLAGGAELRLVDGIAQFAGAATSPAHRRHGIQNALLAVRLADAAAEGCDLAVIVTQPGSKSHQNAQRCGFHLLYTRAILVRSPEA